MPIFTVGAAGTTSTGFDIAGSAMFYSNSLASRTPSGTTNRRTYTISMWVKKCDTLNSNNVIFCAGESTDDQFNIFFRENLLFIDETGNVENFRLVTDAKYSDLSAWYHIVFAVDTTQATASNRLKVYVNGVQVTSFSTETYPTQNLDTNVNRNINHSIGGRGYQSSTYFNGYLAECILVDGQQLTPTSFGEFDTDSGIWKPINPSGVTFGTNGHYYDFATRATDPVDASGNGLNMTSSNVLSTDYSKDTPTNNYATMNALSNNNSNYIFSEGNLKVTETGNWLGSVGTIGLQSGKWYWEVKYGTGNVGIGIGKVGTSATETANLSSANNGYISKYPDGYEWFKNFSANIKRQNNNTNSNYGTNPSDGSIMMIAFDADNGTIWAGNNGTWFASATQSEIEAGTTTNSMYSGITIDDFFLPTASIENGNLTFNFGSPSYSISSGNSDENGHGNFEYAVPSGYYAINTKNLAEFG